MKIAYEAFGKIFTFDVPEGINTYRWWLDKQQETVEFQTPLSNGDIVCIAPIHVDQISGEIEIPAERLEILGE